jgi:hypothetical protein
VTCADLATDTQLANLISSSLVAEPTARSSARATETIPAGFAVQQLGGLSCEWSNGVPMSSTSGLAGSGYRGLTVTLLPDAAAEWSKSNSLGGPSEGGAPACGTTFGAQCAYDFLAPNAVWISVALGDTHSTIAPDALSHAFTDYVSALRSTVSAATVAASTWKPPAGALAALDACPKVLPDTVARSALGLARPVTSEAPGGGWNIESAAVETTGNLGCEYSSGTSGGTNNLPLGFANLRWISGGAWAWETMKTFDLPLGPPAAFPVPGIAGDDGSWIRCDTGSVHCVVDLVISGNWFEMQVFQAEPGPSPVTDVRAAAVKLAQSIASGPAFGK